MSRMFLIHITMITLVNRLFIITVFYLRSTPTLSLIPVNIFIVKMIKNDALNSFAKTQRFIAHIIIQRFELETLFLCYCYTCYMYSVYYVYSI